MANVVDQTRRGGEGRDDDAAALGPHHGHEGSHREGEHDAESDAAEQQAGDEHREREAHDRDVVHAEPHHQQDGGVQHAGEGDHEARGLISPAPAQEMGGEHRGVATDQQHEPRDLRGRSAEEVDDPRHVGKQQQRGQDRAARALQPEGLAPPPLGVARHAHRLARGVPRAP